MGNSGRSIGVRRAASYPSSWPVGVFRLHESSRRRTATEAYLKQLAAFPNRLMTDKDRNRVFDPQLPQFPVGTQLAVAREMFVIDDNGKIQPTHLIESIRVADFSGIPKVNPAKPSGFDGEGKQDFHELRLTRKPLFAGENGGLHAVTPEEPEFVLLNPMPVDPFEQDDPSGPSPRKSCIHVPLAISRRESIRCSRCGEILSGFRRFPN